MDLAAPTYLFLWFIMTKKQAFALISTGAIIKYDDMYLLRCDEFGNIETSLDGIHWIVGILTFDPPTEYSIFKIIRMGDVYL